MLLERVFHPSDRSGTPRAALVDSCTAFSWRGPEWTEGQDWVIWPVRFALLRPRRPALPSTMAPRVSATVTCWS